MKLFVLLLLLPMATAVPGFSSVWTWLASFQQPLKNLIDNPLRKSTVPQFILDAGHPWVLANRRKLERLSSAEAFLCSLPESKPSTLAEIAPETGLLIPDDLFCRLEIDNSRVGISRPGWPNALERLGEMKRCLRALQEVKTLAVNIYIHDSPYSDHWHLEPSQPPEQLLTLSGDVLESMTNLERLQWGIRKEDTHFFEEAFMSRNLTLLSINHLEPGPYSQYLVSMCPNLETLQSGIGGWHGYMPDGRDWGLLLIQAAASASKLKRFAMVGGRTGWTTSHASEVVRSMPQLESLGVLETIGSESRPYFWNDDEVSSDLEDILFMLNGLENLTHLDLPPSYALRLGFDGGSGCGNAYFGKGGRAYGRQVSKKSAEATEEGGKLVIANLPHLTSFTIGGAVANVTRIEGKIVNATWPWTGRMDEWLMEHWPEPEIGSYDPEDVEYDSM